LYELAGLRNVFMSQLHSFGDVERDPGARVISIAYFTLIRLETFDLDQVSEHGAKWFSIKELPELIFDHHTMVNLAHEQLKKQARYQPIGFELLPEKFTLPQLIKLYEEIYQEKIDDRNFRKKIKAMNLLLQLNEKDKSGSKKGAYYYSFEKSKYKALLAKGFNFEL
jgi:hypothetical protein